MWFRTVDSTATMRDNDYGPGIGEEIAHVVPDRAGGKLIEYVAEIRPRVETVPHRTGANAQEHGGGLQSAVAPNLQPIGAADRQWTDAAKAKLI